MIEDSQEISSPSINNKNRSKTQISEKAKDLNKNETLIAKKTFFKESDNKHYDFNLTLDENALTYEDMERIYPKDENPPIPITKAKSVPNCAIMKYGVALSKEIIDFSFCLSCDPSSISPICEACLNQCHKDHKIKTPYSKGIIKCFCGYNNHSMTPVYDTNEHFECSFSEWSKVSKLNVFFYNAQHRPLCIFCHNFCSEKNLDQMQTEEDSSKIPDCSCTNEEVHGELKRLFEKMKLIVKPNCEVISQLHPIQKINLLFKSENSFNTIYIDFKDLLKTFSLSQIFAKMAQTIFVSTDFTKTNCYYSLKNLEIIIDSNKHTGLRYTFRDIEKYFSFKSIKTIFEVSKSLKSDNVSYWAFRQKMLHLFHKIYIGNQTQKLGKYKLYDLENLTPLQRLSIFHKNKEIFPESGEIITFFIKSLNEINSIGLNNLEFYNAINEIYAILRKCAIYSIISNGDMIRISSETEKLLKNFSELRKKSKNVQPQYISNANNEDGNNEIWNKETKLFLNILKMLHNFIYTYNDRAIYNMLTNTNRFPKIDEINPKNSTFIFSKNDLGRLIAKITINIMGILNKNYHNKSESDIYIKIMRHGMKITNYLLTKYDNYLLMMNKFLKTGNYYLKIINISTETNQVYKNIVEQKIKIEESYSKYFSFEQSQNEVAEIVEESLEDVNKGSFDENKIMCLIKSNYFYSLAKVFEIFYSEISDIKNINQEKLNRVIDKIYDFFNNFIKNNSDNAILVLSNYIFKNLIHAPIEYGIINYKLFNECLSLISEKDKVICFSKHILKNLYDYLILLHKKQYKEINLVINLFLKSVEFLVLKIKCLNPELLINKVKIILVKLNEIFNLVKSFFTFKTTKSQHENEQLEESFYLYLKLINSTYDSKINEDIEIISKIVNTEDVSQILKVAKLKLPMRTEFLRYIRKNFVDLKYSNKDSQAYVCSFINVEDNLSAILKNQLISNFQYPTKVLNFKKDLYNIELKNEKFEQYKTSCFDYRTFNVLTYELTNVEVLTEDTHVSDKNGREELKDYFEHGLLIPLYEFFKKSFYVIHCFTGKENLNLFDLIILSLKLKIYISKYKYDFWKEENEEDENNKINEYIKEYNSNESRIDGSFCLNEQIIKNTEENLLKMEKKNFECFDYSLLYQILHKNFFFILKDIPLCNILEDFNDGGDEISLKAVIDIENNDYPEINTFPEIKRRFIRIGYAYKYGKESISDEENSSLFSALSDISLEFETNYRNLLINILINNGEKKGMTEQFAKMSFYILFKLLSLQTKETQSEIISLLGGTDSEELGFMLKFNKILFKRLILLFIDYINPNDNVITLNYFYSLNLIKIFKFLCEEHNNFFQGHLIKSLSFQYLEFVPNYIANAGIFGNDFDNDQGQTLEIKFFEFFLHVLIKIILVSQWEKLKNEDDKHINGFLFDLFSAILELLIEIIQGNKPEFLSKIGNPSLNMLNEEFFDDDISEKKKRKDSIDEEIKDPFQLFVINIIDLLFKEDVSLEIIFGIRNQLMEFFTAILEEKNCNEEVQKFIIKYLNIQSVLSSILTILKTYFIEKKSINLGDNNFNQFGSTFKNEDEENNQFGGISLKTLNKATMTLNENSTMKMNNISALISNLFFNHQIYAFFKNEYYNSEDFCQTNEFQLANIFYRYIKLISVQDKSFEATSLINRVAKMSENTALKKFNQNQKNQVKEKSSMKQVITNLINENTQNFDTNFIELFYIVKFFESITETIEVRTEDPSNRNQTVVFTVLPEMIYLSEASKLEFIKIVDRESETTKKNDLMRHVTYFIKEIKFYQKKSSSLHKIISSTDFYYVQIFSYIYAVGINIFMLFTLMGDTNSTNVGTNEERRKNKPYIKSLIDLSIKKWGTDYNIVVYLYVGINGILIIIWIYFRMPLYFRLDKVKYMEDKKITDKSKLTIWNKLKIAFIYSIWDRDYVSTLIFEFIISLIGAIMERGEIIYPILLLPFVNLNSTLKNLISSIKINAKKISLTFLLAVIIMYVFANIAFFFFNSDYSSELEYQDDNFCKTLIFCFLTALDSGLRARGGLGDSGVRLSFERRTTRYVFRLIADVAFFILIVIVMIDMVFGIIVNGFNDLRVKQQMHQLDKENNCFICHIDRATVEKNKKDFREHVEKKHNLWNYVDYMIYLKFADIHNLNAINSYAREKIDNKDISWLPTYKDKIGSEEGKADDDEDELKVEEENIHKYVVKEA